MEKRYSKYGYIYILPFFAIFLVFSVYPIFYTLYLSFTKYNLFTDPEWIGLDNYIRVLDDRFFKQAFWNTVRIWGVNIIMQVGTAFLLVMIFSDLKYKFKGLNVFRIMFYLPNLIAATSVSLIFVAMLNTNYGVINELLYAFKIQGVLENWGFLEGPIRWLEEGPLAQFSVSSIQTWMWFGNSFILFMASIQAVNKEAIESAVIDGAGRFQIMRHIKLPLIQPILVYVGITSLIGGLQLFDVPLLLTDGLGAPDNALNTVILYSFNQAFRYQNFGYAAAITYVLFIIIFFISIAFVILMYRRNIIDFFKRRKKLREMEVQNNG